jgi:hypothetical protein
MIHQVRSRLHHAPGVARRANAAALAGISTLRSHIEAMGGQLDVIARFPDGAVKISNFGDLGSAAVA